MYFLKLAAVIIFVFICGWIPLVGAYDYESALAAALLGIIFIPILGPQYISSDVNRRNGNIARYIGAGILFFVITNAIFAGIALIRGDFCEPLKGLQYQLLIALPSNILAACLGGWVQHWSRHKAVRILIYIGVPALDFGFALFALYQWPPLVAFGQFFGYFAGSIYDESIHVFDALIAYRLGTAVLCLCFIAAQIRNAGWVRRLVLPLIGIAAAGCIHYYMAHTGQIVPMGRSEVRSALWASVSPEDGAFTVHFVPDSKSRHAMNAEKTRILADFSREYEYLESFFNARPERPIDIWMYPDSAMKGEFIGARRTSFARVWKYETHLVERAPDSTLARHEMAHLFAASFGNSPFKLAGAWGIPALGWIEGLAMAAEWPISNGYNLHTWSAALMANKETFGSVSPLGLLYGFWGMPSRVAYTMAGSFVRWLIDRYGIEKVKVLSQNTPGSFEDIVGREFPDVFDEWKRDISVNYKNADAESLAPLVFGASSIWSKKCARSRAASEQAFYTCLDSRTCALDRLETGISCGIGDECDDAARIAELERLWALYIERGACDDGDLSYTGGSFPAGNVSLSAKSENDAVMPENPVDYSASQFRTAISQRLDLLDEKDLPPAARLLWRERRADMMWHAGFSTAAAVMYASILTFPVPETIARRLEIKCQAACSMQSPVSQNLRLWFADPGNISIERLALEYPHAPILSYLDFINAVNQRKFDRARRAFARVFFSLPASDQATQLTPRAFSELFRMAPLM